LGESSSLFDTLHPTVDIVDLFPRCNCRVQIGIWLKIEILTTDFISSF